MDEQQLTQHERRAKRREEEQKGALVEERRRKLKKIFHTTVAAFLLGGGLLLLIWFIATRPSSPSSEIIATNGLHWHPELSIVVKGEQQVIPADVGIGRVHEPLHTHDATGTIHLELSGIVRPRDIQLGRFFEIWGKRFDTTCILEHCTGPDGKMTMFVNGQENHDFEKYAMHDHDKIEIRFE